MIFEFRIWGLFLLFILLTFYSLSKNNHLKKSNYFYILFGSYFLEFIYIIAFITNGNSIMTRIYSFVMIVVLSLYMYYFICLSLRGKYKLKDSMLEKKLVYMKEIIFVFDVLFLIVSFVINESYIFMFINVIGFVSAMIQLILLLAGRKYLEKRQYYVLLGFVFIELVLFVFQVEFPKIEIFQSLVILLTTYLYVSLENPSYYEASDLLLEREYSDKNILQKQEFLKKLSHEIRIPINTIDGFSQVIGDAHDIQDIKDDVKDIRMASDELIELINGMIDLSILESQELKLYCENYNIYDVFDDFSKMIPSRLKSKNVRFDYHIEKDIPEVLYGDVTRIKQIILNIISNSIKYTDKGSIGLDIDTVKSNYACRLIIKISDTGKGISQEEIQRLLSHDGDEKGIGLRVAYYLLQLMNGKMDIDSSLGEGTVVTVTVDQEIVALKEEKKEKKKEEIQFLSFKEKRIMLVDDNKLNLKVASKLLKPYDVEVITVSSGQECLDYLDQDNHIDLILMDDMMPNMSGIETLDILRKIERVTGFYIPVVALTANATSGMKEKYLDNGFDDYLSKPIDRVELDRVIKKYLK